MVNTTGESQKLALNPVDPSTSLKPEWSSESVAKTVHPQQTQFEEDSAVTKAEKYERHANTHAVDESPSKRVKLDPTEQKDHAPIPNERRKGVAPVKAESAFLHRSLPCILIHVQVHSTPTR